MVRIQPKYRLPDGRQVKKTLGPVARVGAVALGALLGSATRRGLGRLGEMHLSPDGLEFRRRAYALGRAE